MSGSGSEGAIGATIIHATSAGLTAPTHDICTAHSPASSASACATRVLATAGSPQTIATQRARLVATFKRLRRYRNSRGAYTARSLVGFIRNCGIHRPEHRGMVGHAYDFYRDRSPSKHPRSAVAQRFRDTYSHPGIPIIKSVGVWDTVGSLGVPISGPLGWYSRRAFGFHDVQLSSWVLNAFHTIAVDERRRPFEPTLWRVKDEDASSPTFKQRIEQVWFPGVHSNVGGGYPDTKLSNLTLRWMLDHAASCGLALKPGVLESLEGDCLGKMYDNMSLFYRALGPFLRPV